MDAAPGVRIAIEPKPYEPRGVNIWRNTADGLLMCQRVESLLNNRKNKSLLKEGHALVAMNPEVGHVLMGFEDLPYAFARCLREGRLAHTHWNSQPAGNYDQDLTLGTVSPEQAEAGLYVMKMNGYRGYFGIDVFPERIPIERALINNIDCLRAMNDRVNALDHEKIIYCTTHPDKTRGYLEALLIRSRAVSTRNLSRLPALDIEL
jgi:xylose isomerase